MDDADQPYLVRVHDIDDQHHACEMSNGLYRLYRQRGTEDYYLDSLESLDEAQAYVEELEG